MFQKMRMILSTRKDSRETTSQKEVKKFRGWNVILDGS